MADEQEPIAPPPELETPAIEPQQEPKDKPQTILDVGEQEELTGEGEDWDTAPPAFDDPELDEFEVDGVTYKVPKAVKPHLMKDEDYTQKSQANAEKARELDERETALVQQSQVSEEDLRDRAMAVNISTDLQNYEKVDWDAFEAQDPFEAQKHWRKFQTLKQQAGELVSRLQTRAGERTQKAQQEIAKRIEETAKFAQGNIPGWKPELDDQIVKFAMEEGVPRDFLRTNMSPTLYKILHRAFIGTQTLARTATPRPQTPAPTPLKVVGGKSTPAASKTLADLANSTDVSAYAEARKAGRVR